MKKTSLDLPATKRDLEDVGAHIVSAISKTLEEYVTKDDLKNVAMKDDLKNLTTKEDIKHLEHKVDTLSSDVSGLRNRVADLEMKHASPHPHQA